MPGTKRETPMSVRYLYNWKDHQPVLYQDGNYLYSMSGQPKHWLNQQYGYSHETQQPSLWLDGKYVYGLNADATLQGSNPLYYFAD